MKKVICLIFLSIPLLCFGQNSEPKYYLNGKEIDLNSVFFNEKNIVDVNAKRDPPPGYVSILTKDRDLKFKTLDKVLRESDYYSKIHENTFIPIFIINGNVINDTSKVKIEDSFYTYVGLKSLEKVQYLNQEFKKIVLVNIICFDPKDKRKNMILRGSSHTYLDSVINQNK
jgi:hypothetical protein